MRRSRSLFVRHPLASLLLIFCLGLALCGCSSPKKIECGPPIANAGPDISGAKAGDLIVLRGSSKLPPENQVSCQKEASTVLFHWEQKQGETVVLEDPDRPETSFRPLKEGTYSFSCMATYPNAKNPSLMESQPDTVVVEVAPCASPKPVADAGDEQTVALDSGGQITVTLDGSRSQADSVCPGVELTRFAWTVKKKPASVTTLDIQNADKNQASVALSVLGEYSFQLEVKDNAGTINRVDIATAEVKVTLVERPHCDAELKVTVIDAISLLPIPKAHVTVVDAGDQTVSLDSDDSGVANFTNLASGARKSITVISDLKVKALRDTPDATNNVQRPLYEATTVLSLCNSAITIPVRQTTSGVKSAATGFVTGKVPGSIFDALPHSFKCDDPCPPSGTCNDAYYCETAEGQCQNQCTPKSLLPFFSLGDPNISGQFRMAVLVPVWPYGNLSNFTLNQMFAPPPELGAVLPGNMSTDDSFLNGLAHSLGYEIWGGDCTSISACPNSQDYSCEDDESGKRRCRDLSPLRNLKMEVLAGSKVRLALLVGITNVSIVDLIPVLLPLMDPNSGGATTNLDMGGLLGAFKMSTLHVCQFDVAVEAGGVVDLSSTLAAMNMSTDCYNVEYAQQETIDPILDKTAMRDDNKCTGDPDCSSDRRCLRSDANDPTSAKYCFMPMYRVRINPTLDALTLRQNLTAFNPTNNQADTRLHSFIPATASHEQMCQGSGGNAQSCTPKIICERAVDADSAEARIPYGISLATISIPPGKNQKIPEGGRIPVGFNFNFTTLGNIPEPKFLVPPTAGIPGATVEGCQTFVRNMTVMQDGSYSTIPGGMAVTALSPSGSQAFIAMPPLLPLPALAAPPADKGMNVRVSFVAQNPFDECASAVFSRIYAVAQSLNGPAGAAMPATATYKAVDKSALRGIVVSRVDRITPALVEFALIDSMWRIYAPPGEGDLVVPLDITATLFKTGDEVWISPWAARFAVPFVYDFFSNDLLLTRQTLLTSDQYSAVIP